MTTLTALINFCYIVTFIAVSVLMGHYLLLDNPEYTSKWQSAALGLIFTSISVVVIHVSYKLLKMLNKDPRNEI